MHDVIDIILRLRGGPAFEAAMARARASVRNLSGSLDRFSKARTRAARAANTFTKGVGIAAGVGLIGLAVGLKKSLNLAADFEQQMSRLGSVSGANAKQMGLLRKEALSLGRATQYSALEVARAQTELAKGGLGPGQITGGATRAALALAAAGEMDLADAATTTVNAMKQFGLQGRDTMRVADMLATAANKTTGDVSDFAVALRQGGSAAHIAGLSMNETVTALEALADNGIKGSDAGTSLRTMLLQLASPTSKRARELTRKLGLSFFDLHGNMRSLPQVAGRLRTAFDGMTRQQKLANGYTLVGQDGLRALLSLYTAGPRKLAEYEKANARSGTAVDVTARKQANLRGVMERMRGSLETFGITLGLRLLPYLRRLTIDLTRFIDTAQENGTIDSLAGSIKFLISVGVGAVRFLLSWINAWQRGNPVVVAATGAMVALVIGVVAYSAAMRVAGAMNLLFASSTPIGLVVLLTGAFVALYLKVAWFRRAVQDTWSWIKQNWIYLAAPFSLPLQVLLGTAKVVLGFFRSPKDGWGALKEVLLAPFKGLARAVGGVFNLLKTQASGLVNDMVDILNPMIDAFNHLPGPNIGDLSHVGKRGVQDFRRRSSVIANYPTATTQRRVPNLLLNPRIRLPGQAFGGYTQSGGASWVGEQGPELLELPSGAQVRPLLSPRTNGTLKPAHVAHPVAGNEGDDGRAGGGTYILQAILNSRVLAEAVYDENRRRAARK